MMILLYLIILKRKEKDKSKVEWEKWENSTGLCHRLAYSFLCTTPSPQSIFSYFWLPPSFEDPLFSISRRPIWLPVFRSLFYSHMAPRSSISHSISPYCLLLSGQRSSTLISCRCSLYPVLVFFLVFRQTLNCTDSYHSSRHVSCPYGASPPLPLENLSQRCRWSY